jgi:uncharacterized protein (TIGR02147 family)
MNEFYQNQSYVELLRHSIERGKRLDSTMTAQRLAQAIGVQKSYISKVLGGGAQLNSDQLYLIGEFYQWSREQLDFALLLLEFERSGIQARKKELRLNIEKIQQQNSKIRGTISAPSLASDPGLYQDYYLNPWVQIVHIGLSIARYSNDINSLAEDLFLPSTTVQNAVRLLLKRNIIREQKGGGFEVVVPHIHLDKDSVVFKAWQSQLRLLALQRLQSNAQKTDYSFSAVFSADEPTRKRLQSEILALLKNTEVHVRDAKEKDIFCLALDFFQWTN